MRTVIFCALALCMFLPSIASGATHHFYRDFVITQDNPAAGGSLVVNPVKQPPEIAYFESASDLTMFQYLEHNPYAMYTTELLSGGISGGAAGMLGITSTSALHYAGDSPGTMILSSFNGASFAFDPLFSNYFTLVFDIRNIGANDVDILPRIGPNGANSNSSIYYAFDKDFNPVNIKTLAPGDTATFIFDLGLSVADPSVVWDYANGPYSQLELLFQPVGDTGFDMLIDNMGFAVPEPGAIMLSIFGAFVLRRMSKTNKN
ncbi:MAG: hypothetical protein C4541_07065 [Candidatus Auribacter fodinae]|uniref:PEP-CTERM sorting domain-containing protein n=1 Tax=Candidatus Auribacter fodinae TaxID=2093366 RepID=A0A3A4QYK4_9BACT|nr:MAG: hypothetical protein C4541_07065 [Candidatus Auribacter fodinae]